MLNTKQKQKSFDKTINNSLSSTWLLHIGNRLTHAGNMFFLEQLKISVCISAAIYKKWSYEILPSRKAFEDVKYVAASCSWKFFSSILMIASFNRDFVRENNSTIKFASVLHSQFTKLFFINDLFASLL